MTPVTLLQVEFLKIERLNDKLDSFGYSLQKANEGKRAALTECEPPPDGREPCVCGDASAGVCRCLISVHDYSFVVQPSLPLGLSKGAV